jgi:NADPH:quinone reductase-like Zn-dependent oxidoreductase
MRAARLHETGGPDKLVVEEVPAPEPLPGEVRLRVHAAALNHRDVFITQGRYPNIALPAILGSDGAGVVDALGEGVAGIAIGTEAIVNPMLDWGDDPHVWSETASLLGMPRAGTFAQYVCVPAANVHHKPRALSMEEAAALPLAGLTAYRATVTRGALQPGETILITGVGGGVQTLVLLFAKHIGARAIVTSGSDAKLKRARELGADVAVNYRSDAQWHKTVRAAGPIDMLVDSTGGEMLAKALGTIRPGGRAVVYGATLGDATLKMFPIFWNHLDIRGTSMGSPADFRGMLDTIESGVRPAIDRAFPLDDIAAAAARMLAAEQFGKIVITIP